MIQEKNSIIQYEGKQIALFSDEKNDFVNITDIATAWKGRKSIKSWLKNKQTLAFLEVWERKHNPSFNGAQMGAVKEMAKDSTTSLSIKYYIEKTGAIGIFTRTGSYGGTYAHKDIAIRFAGWLSPEFELHIVEEIQRLKELERKKYSYDLLNHEQILFLVRLKEVFKYVAYQTKIENTHKEVFAARSGNKNPFAGFHKWRNEILDIEPNVINERIKQYCIENNIALTKSLLNKPKGEKILLLDSYDSVRNAVWDFLQVQGEVNALNLANLVGDMIRTEKGEIYRENETNLFQDKQDLGSFNQLDELLSAMPHVKSARQMLEYRKSLLKKKPELSDFNQKLKKGLDWNPK
tara:strand:+ start:102540 stop:103589 length:1050 start_codon:yes stop_codon:yes gene_type:complete